MIKKKKSDKHKHVVEKCLVNIHFFIYLVINCYFIYLFASIVLFYTLFSRFIFLLFVFEVIHSSLLFYLIEFFILIFLFFPQCLALDPFNSFFQYIPTYIYIYRSFFRIYSSLVISFDNIFIFLSAFSLMSDFIPHFILFQRLSLLFVFFFS